MARAAAAAHGRSCDRDGKSFVRRAVVQWAAQGISRAGRGRPPGRDWGARSAEPCAVTSLGPTGRRRRDRGFLPRPRRCAFVVRAEIGRGGRAAGPAAHHGAGRQSEPAALQCERPDPRGAGGVYRRSRSGPASRSRAQRRLRRLRTRPAARPGRNHLCRPRAQARPAVGAAVAG